MEDEQEGSRLKGCPTPYLKLGKDKDIHPCSLFLKFKIEDCSKRRTRKERRDLLCPEGSEFPRSLAISIPTTFSRYSRDVFPSMHEEK